MLRYIVSSLLLLSTLIGFAQTGDADTSYWHRGFKGSITFTQVSLSNWAAGGENSLSLNSYVNLFANYEKGRIKWENNLETGYGFVDQEESGFRKTDDRFNISTKLGYLLTEGGKLKWSNLLDFKTQFDRGFNFPDDSTVISKFMAPGYLLISTGLEYSPNDHLTLLYSPITGKMTFVTNQKLANAGAFGVEPAVLDINGVIVTDGETARAELGTFIKAAYKKEIFTNVTFETKLELFTNYVKNFGDIDVNWENLLLLKVNEWLAATLVTQLIYDKDVRFPRFDASGTQTGTTDRVQFKEIFGIAISYTVSNR